MKIIYIILGVIILAFIVVQVYAMKGQSGIETYSFKVEKTYETFEIRNYEATLFTMVKLPPSEYKTASGQGFRLLAGYIFGGNEGNEKIAMTSPVSMSLEDSMTMMFMVPKQYKREDLPKPNESQVKFHVEPEKRVAAITFGGWADDEKIEKYKQQLIKSLEAEGIKYTNRFYFLGYNAPYEIANRKNEIIVEL
tara:strand:+ start:3004 stop:3585 length:582 start_codon:yes stop_codon:yes gene_type:complete